jgi:hypothetical protein
MRSVVVAVLGVLVVQGLAVSARAGAPTCEGRYVLTSVSAPLPAGWDTRATSVVVEGRKVAIDDVCDATGGRVRARPEGDRVRVGFTKWIWVSGGGSFAGSIRDFHGGTFGRPRLVPVSRCEGVKGVKLEARVSADCATMTGRIRARAPAFDVEFSAAAE